MPSLSRFHGIVIYMYYREEHRKPHFSASYSGKEISVFIPSLKLAAGTVGRSGFNRKAWRLVEKWARLHQEELMEAWEARSRHDPLPEIDPLP